MNGHRQTILQVWSLPFQVTMHFDGHDGTPERSLIRPVFRFENTDKTLATLSVDHHDDKKIIIMLPESLMRFGLGRYEVCLFPYADDCRVCDCAKVEFMGQCKITRLTGCPTKGD